MYFVLRVSAGRYVCWNSWSSSWYLGPFHLSEIFCPNFKADNCPRLVKASRLYPAARLQQCGNGS